MATFIFTNNANSTLAAAITAASTTITVASGDGARFPGPGVGEQFMVTLENAIAGTREVCICTSRAGDVLTVTRAQEGTAAQSFAQGTVVSHRITAGTIDWILSLISPVAGGAVYRSPSAGDAQVITPGAASDVALTLTGAVGQTAALQAWKNSGGTTVASMGAGGDLTLAATAVAQRVQATVDGTEAAPALRLGSPHGFRTWGGRFAVVVDNVDSAVFEAALTPVGSLDDYSILTKAFGDQLYAAAGNGTFSGPVLISYDDPVLDLNDTVGGANPNYSRIRSTYAGAQYALQVRTAAGAAVADVLAIPIGASGATAVSYYINGALAAAIAAAGTSAPAPTTIMTREKGDARFAAIAHQTNTSNPHNVTAAQVTATGTWATVQAALADFGTFILSDLNNVTITSNTAGEILKWNGSAWVNNTLAEAGIAAAVHTHAAADIVSGTFADARISQSSVTQWQASLSLTESQISDLGTYAPITSPTLLGTPQAPTPSVGDASAKIATTSFVDTAIKRKNQILHVQDQKTTGTAGGASTASFAARDLNTVLTNEISGASLATNQVTLPAGTYWVEAMFTAHKTNPAKLRLQNITDGATLLEGINTNLPQASDSGGAPLLMRGRITLAAPKVLEVQAAASTARPTDGWGQATSLGAYECYGDLLVQRAE